MEHTFVICAYKDSPYIEECIKSLKKQTVPSKILLATATPSQYLENLCATYSLEYHVRTGVPSIGADWNYALSLVDTPYATIAHQDDIYESNYIKRLIAKADDHSLIIFSDYSELINQKKYENRINMKIKKILLRPLINPHNQGKIGRKRCVLKFGNAICCPSVTYHIAYIRKLLEENGRTELFQNNFRSNLDWEAWEWLSRQQGSFVYVPESLMAHRIHEESETSVVIGERQRGQEDYNIFCKFWPKWVAKLLVRVYGTSEKGNKI